MVDRAEGANPTAEEAAEDDGEDDCAECPEQRPIEGVGGQQCSYGDEGVHLEEPIYGPVAELPEFVAYGADDAEPNEEGEKENLTYSSCPVSYTHLTLPTN